MSMRRNDRGRLRSDLMRVDASQDAWLDREHKAYVKATVCPDTSTTAVTEYLPLALEMAA